MEHLDTCHLVAVHVGAGMHSQSKDPLYKAAMHNACKAAIKTLEGDPGLTSGGGSLRAVCSAIKTLEVGVLG